MARRCLRDARIVTAVSPYLAEMVEPYSKVTVSVIQNPLPDNIFSIESIDRVSKGNSINRVIAMVMNGWGKLKNPEPAMVAFHALRKRMPQCELHLYGADFGEGERAQLWANSKGIGDGMKFVGRLPHTELIRCLQSANVLLHPSLLEGCPMGIAEAMSLGLPIVGGINSGGVPWVVGEGGLLVDVNSPQEITDALYELLTNSDFSQGYGEAAALRARKMFSASTVVDMYEVQYRNALQLK
jgi:glycosyltransferase involved in cell wall biosynthesis